MEINNNINLEKSNNNFLNNIFGKTINTAIDIGLRAILPDLIENQIIDIKNSLLENGLKSGINTAINSAVDFGKSAAGIVTGNFENINQVKIAIGNGGIVDNISNVLDKVINTVYQKGYINRNTKNLIKNGKNVLLNNISNNIKNQLQEQTNAVEKLEKYLNNWKMSYNKKDFSSMEKIYNKIEEQSQKIIPLENIINETKQIKVLHNLIKNNGQNFDISKEEKRLVKNFAI